MKRIYGETFRRLWLAFKEGTDVRLYNPEQMRESHGRRVGLALSIKIDEAQILNKIVSTANRMQDIPGLYIFPPEYYHITVLWDTRPSGLWEDRSSQAIKRSGYWGKCILSGQE